MEKRMVKENKPTSYENMNLIDKLKYNYDIMNCGTLHDLRNILNTRKKRERWLAYGK